MTTDGRNKEADARDQQRPMPPVAVIADARQGSAQDTPGERRASGPACCRCSECKMNLQQANRPRNNGSVIAEEKPAEGCYTGDQDQITSAGEAAIPGHERRGESGPSRSFHELLVPAVWCGK